MEKGVIPTPFRQLFQVVVDGGTGREPHGAADFPYRRGIAVVEDILTDKIKDLALPGIDAPGPGGFLFFRFSLQSN